GRRGSSPAQRRAPMPSTWTTRTWSGSPTGGPTRWSASTRRPRSSRRFRASAAARTCARSSGAPARCGRRSPAPIGSSSIARSDAVKLLFFDDFRLGVLTGDAVVDVSPVVRDIPHTGPHDLVSGLIERFADYKGRLADAVGRGRGVPVGQVRIRPPLPKPYNIVAMAVNYMEDGTRDMAHRIPRCIEWVTSIHTLEPGDVLATGTNHRGLSAFQDGDMVELETERLGRLRIRVRDELKRTWARETRLERQEKKLEG